MFRRIRRWYRRVRYLGTDRIPIKFRHPVDQLIFYCDACGFPGLAPEQERAMRAFCDEVVEVPAE